MDFKLLKILDKCKPLFQRMDIDYEVMRRILYIKLLLDGRRVPTVFGNNKKGKDADDKNMFLRSLWIYLLMGLILLPFVMMKNNYLFQMSIVFGIVMFLVMTSLISDFSSVLLDIRDRSIIGSRPVGRKTLSMAKSIHILYYMLALTAALVGPALVASLFFQGPVFFLLFIVSLILVNIFCIVLTTLVYFLVLRFFDGEKLKDIINYIQIILSLVVMVGYQLIGRMFRIVDLKIDFKPGWWQYLIPPIWFSAPFQMLKKSEINNYFIIFSAMTVIIPLVSLIIYIRLMPLFEKNLQKLGNNNGNRVKRKRKSEGLLVKLLCHNKEEKIFYSFSMKMMKNERSFKLKVYPTIGFSLIFPFLFLFQSLQGSGIKELTQGKTYLFIYFCGIMLPTLLMMTRYSESYKASWIYKALPIGNLKSVYQGTIKAFIIRIFLPVYAIEAAVFGVLYGTRIIPDLFAVLLNLLIFSILCFLLLDKKLPFSIAFNTTQQTNSGMGIALIFLLVVQVGLHFIATLFAYGVFIYLCISVIILIILWETAFAVSHS